jgi:hypothetical protein
MDRKFGAFFSRTTTFARRVFPTRCKLTCEPGCVGKMTTPATTRNSRFAGGFPRLTGIFAGKIHENSSGTPTSGSHNSLFQTPIHANFIPLESTSRAFRKYAAKHILSTERPLKLPSKIGSEKDTRTKTKEDSVEGLHGR